MSTNGTIARQLSDGTFEAIYSHWDSYPSHHAPILKKHYGRTRKMDSLFKYGDVSVLDINIGRKHDFDTRDLNGQCNFYGRDRNEPCTNARLFNTFDELARASKQSGAYLYVRFNGKPSANPKPMWMWSNTSKPNELFACTGDEDKDMRI